MTSDRDRISVLDRFLDIYELKADFERDRSRWPQLIREGYTRTTDALDALRAQAPVPAARTPAASPTER